MNKTATRQIYEFIRNYVAEHGYSPSQREIAAGCYLSQAAVYRYLLVMEAWGWISRVDGQARSIQLVKVPDG